MIPSKVSDKDGLNDLKTTVSTSHSVRVTVQVTDLDGNVESDLSSRLLSGQVDVDGTAEVTRTLSMELWDIDGSISFDPDSPNKAAMFLNKMIKVQYGVYLKKAQEWLDIPVFLGPIVNLKRNDDIINIECQGKDYLVDIPVFKGDSFPEKSDRFKMIRNIMNQAGEANGNMQLPENESKHGSKFVYNTEQTYWQAVKRLAASARHRAYYNGAGKLVVTDDDAVVFSFRDGTGGTVVSQPQVSYNADEVINTVIVKGQRKVGQGKNSEQQTLIGTYIIKSNHPLSPESLGRKVDGKLVPRYLVERIEDEGLRSIEEVNDYGNKRLAAVQKLNVEVTFDAMPIPFLEPGDTVRVETDEVDTSFVIQQFTIPLIVGDSMSVGYNRRMAYGRSGEARKRKVRVIKPKKNRNKKNNNKGGKGKK